MAYWINERERIRQAREAGLPAPWSSDPAMSTVRYCNVHREDDKVTRWLRGNPVYSRPDIPVWVVVLSRMVNRIETLEALAEHVTAGNLNAVASTLKTLRHTGPIWGNAYTISTCGKSMDKVDYVVDWVVGTVRDNERRFHGLESCEDMFAMLTKVDGLGSFLAGQVVADLKNIEGHNLQLAHDWLTFAVHGPGSLKGLSAYYGAPVTPKHFKAALRTATAQVAPMLGLHVRAIHAQDMQNCFCEFSKFIRFRQGGHVRNRYAAI